MKKFAYLCGMVLLSLNMMAQLDPYDKNWKKTFGDDFSTGGRSWVNWSSSPDKKWRGYGGNGVTHGNEHQVYQYANCVFNTAAETMELVAAYDSTGIISSHAYELPAWMNNQYPPNGGLFYFSGEIDARKDSVVGQDIKFLYGYFEIRCKLPIHRGAFPAFWLQSASKDSLDPYYEEIDIFEYNWGLADPHGHHWLYSNPNSTYAGDPYVITTGLYHNLTGDTIAFNENDSFARNYPRLPNGGNDVSGWHTYSCEWMPEHVYWFLDGVLVNSYYNVAHIPQHPLTLKTNYAIDRYALVNYSNNNNPAWFESDTMTIDYIKVYQLDWDCDTDETIATQNELNQLDFAVKKSITIAPLNSNLVIGATEKVTFRITDTFEINGPFEVQSGAEFSVIKQECPD